MTILNVVYTYTDYKERKMLEMILPLVGPSPSEYDGDIHDGGVT